MKIIIEESGLTQNTTIYNDLEVHIEYIQWSTRIRQLRTCLFCTFFLESGLIMRISVATFFSGTFLESQKVYPKDTGFIKPVNCITLPSVSGDIDMAAIRTSFKDYITKRMYDRRIEQDAHVGVCLHLLFRFLKVNTLHTL